MRNASPKQHTVIDSATRISSARNSKTRIPALAAGISLAISGIALPASAVEWDEATPVSATVTDTYAPKVVSLPDGSFLAAWGQKTTTSNEIFYATHPGTPGGTWSAPTKIASGTKVSLAVNTSGQVAAIWVNTSNRAVAAIYNQSSGFGTARTLTTGRTVDVKASGENFVFVWSNTANLTTPNTSTAEYANGQWSANAVIQNGSCTQPYLLSNINSNLALICYGIDDGNFIPLNVATKPAAGAWSSFSAISTAGNGDMVSNSSTLTNDDKLSVAYISANAPAKVQHYTADFASAAEGTETTVATASGSAPYSNPAAAHSNGKTVVTWVKRDGNTYELLTAENSGEGFSSPVSLQTSADPLVTPSIGVKPAEKQKVFTAVWTSRYTVVDPASDPSDPTYLTYGKVYSAENNKDGWGATSSLTDNVRMNYGNPDVAINAEGVNVTVWKEANAIMAAVGQGTPNEISIVAPSEPANVAATTTGTSATVTWEPPADNGGLNITGYTVSVKTADGEFSTATPLAADATSYTVDEQAYSTSYTFKVTAVNEAGESTPATSNTVTTEEEVVAAPAKLTGVKVAKVNSKLRISWNAVNDTDTVEYRTYTLGRGWTNWSASTSATYTENTPDRVVNLVQVRVVNKAGASPTTDVAYLVLPGTPRKPDSWRLLGYATN